jgi:energy-coupling factor transporter ATP-binding protein EcfA2
VERVHALEFRWPTGGAEGLIARFVDLGRRAVIVGAEGSGKSTLLARLASAFEVAGSKVRRFAARPGEDAAARLRVLLREMEPRELLLLDGFDHLSRLARFGLLRRAAKSGIGLLATSHHAERALPTLIELAPTAELLEDLARELGGADIDELDFEAIHRRHGGNLRTALRELYDVWAARDL